MDLLPFDEYIATLHRKRMSAAVLLHDETDRIVVVQLSYKSDWGLPGGMVDEGESPWHAAERELREELGIERTGMPPLVIDHAAERPDGMPEGIAWIFDGGALTGAEIAGLRPHDAEIAAVGLHRFEEVAGRFYERLARRITVALDVRRSGTAPVLCDDGTPR